MGADLEDEMLIASPFPWTAPHLVRLKFCALSLVLFPSANGYDLSMINSLQSLPPWEPGWDYHPVYWIGLLLAYTVAPYISDRFGRKICLYVGLLFVTAGAILQGLSPNPTGCIVGRGLAGCAACFWSCNAPVLVREIAYLSHRATTSSFYQCGYYVRSTLAAWIIYGMLRNSSSWSWQFHRSRNLFYHFVHCLVSCSVQRVLGGSYRRDELRRPTQFSHSGMLGVIGTTHLSLSKCMRFRLLSRLRPSLQRPIVAPCSANGVRMGLSRFILQRSSQPSASPKSSEQLIITACLQIWDLICGIGAALLVDLVGKRPLFHSSAIIMTISYIMITAFTASFEEHHERSVGTAVIPLLFIYFASYGIALIPLLIAYPCEIWQFSLRIRGLSITWISSCLFASFNSLDNPIALETISWKYFVFLKVLIVYGITEYYMYPETKGRSLEEIQRLFQSENPEPTSSRATD
ncbi:MFS general substrate transporter [Aspergillus eucalypticola CBS 122712]|uniref:MFS general substrate transporter n=1 Tax=Aspergillus eucalypticola (strain CBS 122712 / IBT 29274) TaxID=1448314 RepID=A0A317VAH4_ASPEC|nr:MFS general substrate transporter [Aspergillus eucalypticola CBS 122712]PWY69968.1 MFS general substrate transporter [Aspergillus eucalypticola CBS 122712]